MLWDVSGEENRVSVVVPAGAFTEVVRLVAAGFASQVGFGFEAIDDVQLAIELVLHSLAPRGDTVTVALVSDASGLTVSVSAFDEASLRHRLREGAPGTLDLLAVIERLVDSVEVHGGEEAAIVLCKRGEAAVA